MDPTARATTIGLCSACEEIFTQPRKLTYGTFYPWNQTPSSYLASLQAGCHLCSIIEANRAADPSFPTDLRYSFKALNETWARHGTGPKWFVPQDQGDEESEVHDVYQSLGEWRKNYEQVMDSDPTPNGLGRLLATDADELKSSAKDFWLVLEIYGSQHHILLPMELASDDEVEELCQKNIQKQTSTGAKEALQLAEHWLRECLTSHDSCRVAGEGSWLPTRLLSVSHDLERGLQLRLVLSSSIKSDGTGIQYVALSHRWSTDKTHVLTSTNLEAYLNGKGLSATSVPGTIREAAKTVHALGLQYLWVDSLCIIQDDAEDWAQESATMSRVYGLATCTIAAANSGATAPITAATFAGKHDHGGCFASRNPKSVRACRVPNPFNPSSKYSFYVRARYQNAIHETDVRQTEWYGRGWVFQERTLSPRMLLFGRQQVLWSCGRVQASETWPRGKTTDHFIDRFESMAVERARFHRLLDSRFGVVSREGHTSWWAFIRDYVSSAALTRPSDRLVALQGIATQVETLTGQRYLAGHWLNDGLPASLLWRVLREGKRPGVVSAKARVSPSWSWAAAETSGNNEIKFFDAEGMKGTALIRVLGPEQVQGVPTDKRRQGVAALRVAGRPVPVTIVMLEDGKAKLLPRLSPWQLAILGIRLRANQLMALVEAVPKYLSHHRLFVILCCSCYIIGSSLKTISSPLLRLVIGLGAVILRTPWYVCCVFPGQCLDWIGPRENLDPEREAERRRDESAARLEQVYKDLEMGVLPPENEQNTDAEIEGFNSVYLQAGLGTELDLDLSHRAMSTVEAMCLPVARREIGLHGLVLRPVRRRQSTGWSDKAPCYERLGVFQVWESGWSRTLKRAEEMEMLLV